MIRNPELLRLARMLHCHPEDLRPLETLDTAELLHLRRAIDARLSREGQAALRGLTAAGKMVPARLSAKIAEKALGPVITAEMARKLEPGRSGKIACHLSPAFMADVARYLPAEDSGALLLGLPVSILRVVTHELAHRGETIVLATLVARLPTPTIVELAAELNAETLADTAMLMDDPAPLAGALSEFAPAVLADAAGYLPDDRIVEIISGLRDDLIFAVADELIRSKNYEELARLSVLIPEASLVYLAEHMDTPSLSEIARRSRDPGKLAETLAHAAPHTLARILDVLPEEVTRELMERVDPDILSEVARELEATGHIDIFERLLKLLPVDGLLSVLSTLQEKTLEAILRNRETLQTLRRKLQQQAQQRADAVLKRLPARVRERLESLVPGRSGPDRD